MKGLNGYTVHQIKKAISSKMNCKISDIRLHGSRIAGRYREDSDLDAVIRNKTIKHLDERELVYENILGFEVEIRYMDTFNVSWLRYSI